MVDQTQKFQKFMYTTFKDIICYFSTVASEDHVYNKMKIMTKTSLFITVVNIIYKCILGTSEDEVNCQIKYRQKFLIS